MFWNRATYFSIMIVSRSAGGAQTAGHRRQRYRASSAFKCDRALAVSPVDAYASARISSFSA